MPNGVVWTRAEINLLIAAVERNENLEQLSARLGRTRIAVEAKAARLGLNRLSVG